MTAALETGRQECCEDLLGKTDADDPGAHTEHVGIVVRTRKPCREQVVAQCGAHAVHLVGGQLLALSTAPDDNADLRMAVAYRTADRGAELGIVAALRAIRSKVRHVVVIGSEHGDEVLFQLVPGMIRADGDSRHPASLWLRRLSTQPAPLPWAVMALDPRTPVLIGVGQTVQHTDDLVEALDPTLLMCSAIGEATFDAGLATIPNPQSLRVVNLLTWKYGDPAYLIAQQLGLTPIETAYTTMGGQSPQSLVNATATEIQAGDLDIAILAGGEARRTRVRARKADVDLDWPTAPEGQTPRVIGDDLVLNHPSELARGVMMPVQIYPIFESAIRARSGSTPEQHLWRVSELWSRFSDVASTNPYAWSRQARTAEEIRTPSSNNRMVGLPYTKYMNSNNDVDMAAAIIMCSAEKAASLGVPRDRWVFVHAGTDCHEHPFVSNRWSFAETPAIEMGGRRALELAGCAIDDVAVVDLYSCFPSAVQLGAQSLGLALGRQLTRTGGLTFAGGPWNNYAMHAIATVVTDLRAAPGELGLVWANGGYATKHAFGIYSTEPPARGFCHDNPQSAIDALPQRELAEPADAAGPATIEAYTVMHSRDGEPETAIAACLLADGRRAWGTTPEVGLAAAMCEGEWVGTRVTLTDAGLLTAG